MKPNYRIVMIEDSPEDASLVDEALEAAGFSYILHTIGDGDLALAYLSGGELHPVPDLLLVDLNLPKLDGLDLVRQIRSHPQMHKTPVVVMSSSDSPQDQALAAAAGCNQYFRKPMDLDEFMKLGELARNLLIPLENVRPGAGPELHGSTP